MCIDQHSLQYLVESQAEAESNPDSYPSLAKTRLPPVSSYHIGSIKVDPKKTARDREFTSFLDIVG